MCFYLHKDFLEPKIAEEDISVHKGLDYNDEIMSCITPCRHKIIKLNSLLESDLEMPKKDKSCPIYGENMELLGFVKRIDVGIHSISPTYQETGIYEWSMHTFRAYIPKGAQYYHNPETQEYVSNQLFITDVKI